MRTVALLLLLLAARGSAQEGAEVAGEWIHRSPGVEVELRLGADGRFTRTVRMDGAAETQSGRWSHAAGTLEILPDGAAAPLRVPCRVVGGALEVTAEGGTIVRMERREPGGGEGEFRAAIGSLRASPAGHILYQRSVRLRIPDGAGGVATVLAPRIHAMDGEGGGAAPFLAPPDGFTAGGARWSADGRFVAFASDYRSSESAHFADAFVAEMATGRVTRVTGAWRHPGPVKGFGTLHGVVIAGDVTEAGAEASVVPAVASRTAISHLGGGGRIHLLGRIGREVPAVDPTGREHDIGGWRFTIENVPAGRIWVKAQASSSIGDLAFVDLPPGGAAEVTLVLKRGLVTVADPSLTPDGRFLVATAWLSGTSKGEIAPDPASGIRMESHFVTGVPSLKVFDTATGAMVGGWDPSVMEAGACRNANLSRDGSTVVFDAHYPFVESVLACSLASLARSRPEPVVLARGGSSLDFAAAVMMRHGCLRPAFSPDGKRIVFLRTVANVDADVSGNLFVMNADGSGARRLTDFPPHRLPNRPCFSPDGRRIAFDLSTSRDGRPINPVRGTNLDLDLYTTDLFTMAADGGDLRRLTDDGISSDPSWGP